MCLRKVLIGSLLVVILSVANTYSATTLTTGLVGYWSNDELIGARMDSVGTDHLTSVNAVGGETGKIGNAAIFEGSLQYLTVSTNYSLSFSNHSFTVSAWVKLNAKTPGIAVSKSRSEYYLGYGSAYGQNMFSDRFSFGVNGVSSYVEANSFGPPSLNTWFHLVAWYDHQNKTINIQINNGPVDSKSQSTGNPVVGNPFWIGTWEGYNNFWNGAIDEVKVWNRVLTTTERQEDYQTGLSGISLLPSPVRTDVIVAPDGSPDGVGTTNDPIDLVTALDSAVTRVQPGGTVWLRGGTYLYRTMVTSTLSGLPGQPITLRSFPGEWATLDGWMTVRGSNVVMRDFEVTNSKTSRGLQDVQDGFLIFAADSKFINLIVHHCIGDGIEFWSSAVNSELYGCLTYDNGFYDPVQLRKRGHNIYTQNSVGYKQIKDNISFHGYDTGLHIYTQDNSIQGYRISENISFDNTRNNLLAGGREPLEDVVFDRNYTYHQFGSVMPSDVFGWSGYLNTNIVVINNYIVGGSTPVSVGKFAGGITFTNNYVVGFQSTLSLNVLDPTVFPLHFWDYNTYFNREDNNTDRQFDAVRLGTFSTFRADTGFDPHGRYTSGLPSANKIVVLPNQYEAGRANIAIYNWQLAPNVDVDVSKAVAVGTAFEVRNVLDYFGAPVLQGVYDGSPLSLPMTNSATSPWFNTFVLLPTAAAQPPAPANTPPTISQIAGQTAVSGSLVGPVAFSVADAETAAGSLVVSAHSSNQVVLPDSAIDLAGSGGSRTITLNVPGGSVGSATVAVYVSDAALTNFVRFTLTVTAPPPVNAAPVVSAGNSIVVTLPASASLLGSAVDDGLPNPPGTVSVTWSVANGPGNVIFADASSLGTTADFSTNGTYQLLLTASDGSLTASSTVTVDVLPDPFGQGVPAPGNTNTIFLEAESASLAPPMSAVADAAAFGSAYVASATAESGTTTFSVDIPESETYVVWCRVLSPNGITDSFYVSVDGGPEDIFDTAEGTWSDQWQWSRLNGRDGGAPLTLNPRALNLTKGQHTLVFRARDASCGLDALIVTSDLQMVPTNAPAPPSNTVPVAGSDSFALVEDLSLDVPGPGVLANDTDDDGDALMATIVATPRHGTVILRSDGGFTYMPASNYNGSDSFTYKATDGQADSAPAPVNLTIAAVNDPPQAVDDQAVLMKNVPLFVSIRTLLANDVESDAGDTLGIVSADSQSVQGGRIKFGKGSITYYPPSNLAGADSFDYTVADTAGATSRGTVHIMLIDDAAAGGTGLSALGTLQAPVVQVPDPGQGVTLISTGLAVSADVSDANGAIVGVEFYADGNYLGFSTNRIGDSFSIVWTNAWSGIFSIAATAISDNGLINASYPIDSEGVIQFQGPLPAGAQVTIEATSDFVQWQTIQSLLNTNGFFSVLDSTAADLGHRYYRLKIN